MDTPHYELAQNITSLLNMVFIVVNEFIQDKSIYYLQIWFLLMIVTNNIFLLELILDFIVIGVKKAFSNHLRVPIETICQIMNIYLMFDFFLHSHIYQRYNDFLKIFTLIIFIRALKMLTLMYEVKSLRIIIETMKNLIGPISNMLSVLMIIFFFYSLLGMWFFGGQIRKNLPYPIQ